MRIPSDAEIQQITERLVSAVYGNHTLMYETTQHLGDLKVQKVKRMEGFVTGIYSVLNALSRGRLKKPVNRGRRIQDDHRASRSSRANRAVSIFAETGLRLCRRSRNSASVGLSAISLISVNR
jgi:hypothetical protein